MQHKRWKYIEDLVSHTLDQLNKLSLHEMDENSGVQITTYVQQRRKQLKF